MIDDRLVVAAQAGDRDAASQVLASLLPRIRHRCNRYAGVVGHLCPDDLVQEVLIQVWRALDRYDPSRGVPFEHFVARKIAMGPADILRNSGPRGYGRVIWSRGIDLPRITQLSWLDVDDGEGHEIPFCLVDARDEYGDLEQREWIEWVAALLPETQRQAFLLYYRDGLTQLEIADQIGVTSSGVCYQLRSARDFLREALPAVGFDPPKRSNPE